MDERKVNVYIKTGRILLLLEIFFAYMRGMGGGMKDDHLVLGS